MRAKACLEGLEGLHVVLEFAGDSLASARIQPAPEEGMPLSPAQQASVEVVRAYLANGRADLAAVPVDLAGVPPFYREVLLELRKVRAGQTVTYGDLAKRLGKGPGASRAIGGAMASNPIPIVVPCHRVLQGDGSLGNYSGFGGTATKLKLLQLEGSRW